LSRLVQFCDIDQPRLARIDSIVIIAGMHRRGRADASVNPHPPNAGDGGAISLAQQRASAPPAFRGG